MFYATSEDLLGKGGVPDKKWSIGFIKPMGICMVEGPENVTSTIQMEPVQRGYVIFIILSQHVTTEHNDFIHLTVVSNT